MRLKEDLRGCSWIVFPFLSVHLFTSFHFSSIKSVYMFVGVQVHPVCCGSLLVTLLQRWTPSTWAESQSHCDFT